MPVRQAGLEVPPYLLAVVRERGAVLRQRVRILGRVGGREALVGEQRLTAERFRDQPQSPSMTMSPSLVA